MIRFGGTFQPIPLRYAESVFFVFNPQHCKQASVENKKSLALRARDWLRSVADSNRRKRFCRPLPSHSVNRPYYIILKELYKNNSQLSRWRIARLTPRELPHFVQSVALPLRGIASSFTPFSRFEPSSLTSVANPELVEG